MKNHAFYDFATRKELKFAEFYANKIFGKSNKTLSRDELTVIVDNLESYIVLAGLEKYIDKNSPEIFNDGITNDMIYDFAECCARIDSKQGAYSADELRSEIEKYTAGLEPEPCHICGHTHYTKLFTNPDVEGITSTCEIIGSSKPMDDVATVWLCKYHYDLLQNHRDREYDNPSFFETIERSNDATEVLNYANMFLMFSQASNKFSRLMKKERAKRFLPYLLNRLKNRIFGEAPLN